MPPKPPLLSASRPVTCTPAHRFPPCDAPRQRVYALHVLALAPYCRHVLQTARLEGFVEALIRLLHGKPGIKAPLPAGARDEQQGPGVENWQLSLKVLSFSLNGAETGGNMAGFGRAGAAPLFFSDGNARHTTESNIWVTAMLLPTLTTRQLQAMGSHTRGLVFPRAVLQLQPMDGQSGSGSPTAAALILHSL